MAEMRFRRRNCEIAFQANGQTSLRRRERAPPRGREARSFGYPFQIEVGERALPPLQASV